MESPAIPARFGLRLAAKITDAVILVWLTGSAAGALVTLLIGADSMETASSTTTALAEAFFFFLLAAPVFLLYQAAFLRLWGATPGKLLWGLEVVTDEGRPIRLWRAFRRSLAEFPSFVVGGLPFLWRWWRTRGEPPALALHDRMTATRVVPAAEHRLAWLGRGWPRRPIGALAAAALLLVASGVSGLAPQLSRAFQPAATRHLLAGIREYSAGDTLRAIEDFSKAIAEDPGLSLAYANRGAAYGDMGRLERQIEDCSKALTLDSTQVFAYLGRANAYRLQQRWPEALRDYSSVIGTRPDWSGAIFAYRGRGAVYYRTGRFDLAAADFGQGVQIASEHSLGTSDFAKGEDFLRTIVMCQWFRSEALRAAGKPAAADEEWGRSSYATWPEGPEIRRGWTREWLGR